MQTRRLFLSAAALAAGAEGGPLQIVELSHPTLFAFTREKGHDRVTVVVNLSGSRQSVSGHPVLGDLQLEPWGWRITTRDGAASP